MQSIPQIVNQALAWNLDEKIDLCSALTWFDLGSHLWKRLCVDGEITEKQRIKKKLSVFKKNYIKREEMKYPCIQKQIRIWALMIKVI